MNDTIFLHCSPSTLTAIQPGLFPGKQCKACCSSIKPRPVPNIEKIEEETVTLVMPESKTETIANDLVYIFAGGELPTQFLQKAGVMITTRFGHTLLKHNKNG